MVNAQLPKLFLPYPSEPGLQRCSLGTAGLPGTFSTIASIPPARNHSNFLKNLD
jgi:hypothetical protein